MHLNIIQWILSCLIVYVIAFEDVIYIYGQVSEDVVQKGKTQYQLLQQRGNLPKYGTCWKAAVEHVEEGCRALSEETQSDIALHITNCFLEMSGLEIYNCELDKKPNLRRICIASMSDKAFNVYTEFYTHTQNICWFLRGQLWQETIAESTLRVGKQLEHSAKNQEDILKSQKESLTLQQQLLQYGQDLEKLMEDFYISTQQHKEILSVMSSSLKNMQSWIVGEISWIDMICFYVVASFLILVVTSSDRTMAARCPIWFLLIMTAVIERVIYTSLTSNLNENEMFFIQNEIYKYMWWLRKCFCVIAVLILSYSAYSYKDMNQINYGLLQEIYEQNLIISQNLNKLRCGCCAASNVSYKTFNESGRSDMEDVSDPIKNGSYDSLFYKNGKYTSFNDFTKTSVSAKSNKFINTPKHSTPIDVSNSKYNLRNRQGAI